jgi:predicted nucleotidyltransferase
VSPNSPATSRSEVVHRLRAAGASVRALGVRRLALFGSFARDEAGAGSDVDLLIQFEPGRKSYDHLLDLGDLLEARLGRRVELVTTEGLSPYLGPRIRAEAQDVPLDA